MFGILLRFREGPLAIHGAIVDDLSGRPLHMNDPEDRKEIYRLLGQAYEKVSVKEKKPGTKQNPSEWQHFKGQYFDSFRTLAEAKRAIALVIRFHRKSGSVCGNFITNSYALKLALSEAYLGENMSASEKRWLNESDGNGENLLDVYWDAENDLLDHRIRIKHPFDFGELPSRREVLEQIYRLNDPLGLMYSILNLKVLLQELQKTSSSWDGQITGRSKLMWNKWIAKVGTAGYATIPRSLTKGRGIHRQLNVFVGGSDLAIAACVYLQSSTEDQRITVNLAAATTEVAPLRTNQSVPRLEVRAAELGAQLLRKFQRETRLLIDETILWTSSQIVLDWITNPNRQCRPFVMEQIRRVQELSHDGEWRLTPADQNPAIDATA